MSSAAKRIVQDGNVAGLEPKRFHGMTDRERHGAQMHRHMIAHGDRLALLRRKPRRNNRAVL